MLEEQPEVYPHLMWVWDAFCEIEKSRQYGFGHPQPISLHEIESYARLNSITGEDLQELLTYVRFLDQSFIAWHRKKNG